jgi:hypothetical protein
MICTRKTPESQGVIANEDSSEEGRRRFERGVATQAHDTRKAH